MFGFGRKKSAVADPDPGLIAIINMLSILMDENDRLEAVIRECVGREQGLRKEMASRQEQARESDRVEAECIGRIAGLEAYTTRIRAEYNQLHAVKATIARTLHQEGEAHRAEVAAYKTDIRTHRAVIDRLIAERDEAKVEAMLLKAKCDGIRKELDDALSWPYRDETSHTHFPSLRIDANGPTNP